MAVTDYSADPNANTSISGINIGEGCPAANVNNAFRQFMADMSVAGPVSFSHATTYAAGTIGAHARQTVSIADAPWSVSTLTTAAANVAAIQAALDTGASKIEIPDFTVTLNASVEFQFDGQSLVGKGANSKLVKSNKDIDRLIYADGLTDVGIENIQLDGVGQAEAAFSAGKWCVFFRSCVRPFVRNCIVVGACTDNIVFELCTDPIALGTTSNDSKKGGFYWSACDGGICVGCTADNNGDTTIGNGFIISCTWGLLLSGIKAKNNTQGQIVMSRGNRDVTINGAVLGDRLQTRGTYSLYCIGEVTSGTVHGVTYDGVTFYGTDDCAFSNIVGYLPPLLNYVTRTDFFNLKIDSVVMTPIHAMILGATDRIRIRGGRLTTASTGVGVALSDFGPGQPTNTLMDGIDISVPSNVRWFNYAASAVAIDRLGLDNGDPLGNAAIADLGITATTGSLPATSGAVLFANAATPTVAELLKAVLELNSKQIATYDRLRDAGIIAE